MNRPLKPIDQLDDLLVGIDPGDPFARAIAIPVLFCADHRCSCGDAEGELFTGAFRLVDLVEAIAKHRARFPWLAADHA